MKTSLVFLALSCLIVISMAIPHEYNVQQLQQELESIWEPAGEVTPVHVERLKRATCDLLSFQSKWVTPNHAGCAAHCLLMFKGYRGGECKGTICHCRR